MVDNDAGFLLRASFCSSVLRIDWSGFGQFGFFTVNIYRRELKSKIGVGLKKRGRERERDVYIKGRADV